MIRRLVLAAAAAFLASPLFAQAPPPPRLLVVISIDQLSSSLFEAYREQFTSGFGRIASGTLFDNGSPREPEGPALGELMKSHWPGSRDVAVSGREGAEPIAGLNPDQHWFWSGTRFQSGLSSARVPAVVSKVNAAAAAALAQPRPPLQATAFCQPMSHKTQLARGPGDAAGLAASPELDGDTLALAAGLVDEMQLGRRADPDLLAVHLSATGNVERAYGATSEEMCLQLTELDREIGDFLSLLDSRGIDYAVTLEGNAGGKAPVALWRPGFKGASSNIPVNAADIAATLATLIDLPLPPGGTGHCLEGTPAFCPQP